MIILNHSLTTLLGFPRKITTPAVFGLRILIERSSKKRIMPMIRGYMGELLCGKSIFFVNIAK